MTIFEIIRIAEGHVDYVFAKNSINKVEKHDTTEIDVEEFIKELIEEKNIKPNDLFTREEINEYATEVE